jgi:hypothetical protein
MGCNPYPPAGARPVLFGAFSSRGDRRGRVDLLSRLSRDVGVEGKVWNLPPKLGQFVTPHGLHPGETPSNGADKAASTGITGNRNAVLPRPYPRAPGFCPR